MRKAVVKAFPRLHATLIDLGNATHRRYGGTGFTLARPETEVEASVGSDDALCLPAGFEVRDLAEIRSVVSRVSALLGVHFQVVVRCVPLCHVGYGSKTTLLLATARACAEAARQPLTQEQLQRVSGRGGTSGIGINGFFTGGFLVDMGHAATPEMSWTPSTASCPDVMPKASVHLTIPDDWVFHLFLPNGRSYRAGDELDMFRRNTPIPQSEVLEIIATVYHGVVPAVAYGDLMLLKKSLTHIHATGFKRRELAAQSSGVRDLLDLLDRNTQAAVGMSSMGPLLYAVVQRSSPSIRELLGRDWSRAEQAYLGPVYGRNAGYEMETDDVK